MIIENNSIAAIVINRNHRSGMRHDKVVMTNGVFDILHSGHIHSLREAKKLGDVLVVAVNSDESVRRLKGPSRPVVRLPDRMAVLDALEMVDYVVPFIGDSPEGVICNILPDVLAKGEDYKGKWIAGSKCVTENGGRVVLIPLLDGRSTTGIINTAVNLRNNQ